MSISDDVSVYMGTHCVGKVARSLVPGKENEMSNSKKDGVKLRSEAGREGRRERERGEERGGMGYSRV